jgi:hypothetical protein
VEEAVVEDADYTAELRLPTDPAVVVEGPAGERTLPDAPSLDAVERAIAEVS